MRNKLIFILLVVLIASNIYAIFDDYEPSPRARAMSGAFYSMSDDAYAIFYNPAGLAEVKNHLGISYTEIFGNDFQVLNTIAFAMELPKKFGNIGIGLQAMDVDFQDVNLLSEKTYALSHSFTLLKDIHSKFDFGYTLNLYHLSIDGYGEQAAFGVNLGVLATLHQRTKIGFAVTNVNNPTVGDDNFHELPQKMTIGISYEPYTGVHTSVEMKKPFAGTTEIHGGTELVVTDMLSLYVGIRSNPVSYSAGAQFSLYDVVINYAFNTHILGGTHHFGIGYKF